MWVSYHVVEIVRQLGKSVVVRSARISGEKTASPPLSDCTQHTTSSRKTLISHLDQSNVEFDIVSTPLSNSSSWASRRVSVYARQSDGCPQRLDSWQS